MPATGGQGCGEAPPNHKPRGKPTMNTDELQLLNNVVTSTLEWYNKNAPEGMPGENASFSDFITDIAIKIEEGALGHDANKIIVQALASAFL